jgi:paraquat-inducible protein B
MNKLTNRPTRSDSLPKVRIKKSRLSWLVWGFPIAAAVFFGALLYHDYLDKNRMVTVAFKDVDGVDEDGNTTVRCRGAVVGTVKRVALSKDHNWATLNIVFNKGQDNLARTGALFWVVRPQVGAGVLRGLETVMSGAFVQIRPGDGPVTNYFTGAEEPPPVELPSKALNITFLAPDLSSLQEQSPIFYRGIQIGEITTYQLGPDSRNVVVHARVHEAYAPLVRDNSVFWNAGGIDMHIGLIHGISVQAESAKALISGAVEMATPDNYGAPAKDGATFLLEEKAPEASKKWNPLIALQLQPEAPEAPTISARNVPATTFNK